MGGVEHSEPLCVGSLARERTGLTSASFPCKNMLLLRAVLDRGVNAQ